ncbi:hypothetical protein ACJRO7_013824 [Eucalyptus globulus]|uniref:Embryogenesis-associated protein EMB8 n=1 Tax=Eucalyptus globulus TaxID=34317 RepID=A0ABD3KYW9_EUCGL
MNHLRSPTAPPPPAAAALLCPGRPFRVREFRVYKRRKLKPAPRRGRHHHLCLHLPPLRAQLDDFHLPPFDDLLRGLASRFSPDLLLPGAFGLASGAALSLGRRRGERDRRCSDVGEWILFSSPTPFNRFVLLRCPSISFEGSEMLEDVNEKLVKEDRHFVRLDSGRMQVRDGDGELEERLAYQRVCVGTEDGGVISIDWPANLDLREERGLDSTLLLVPGTAEGSMDESVRAFVCEALRHGFFPVVMNPRGCAGSPLTTARLFTAADSDDICTAVQFISKARPWTTLMGVGWGFGANMLAKYLAEVGERTPLAAATLINNPFDLEEVTRSSAHHVGTDENLTSGLVDILRSNKELFQGRAKGFDVEKALVAKSVREFDTAISMVSYGYEEIEDFYSKSSTRDSVGSMKIPVLFIQNDDGTVPLFSVPRSKIAENPYTSLLLCSCLPSGAAADSRSALSWCRHLTIEWLAAVELGLLKGRHPLLTDIDVTINPAKGFPLAEGKTSNKGDKVSKYLKFTGINGSNGYAIGPRDKMLEDGGAAAGNFRSRQSPRGELDDGMHQSSSLDEELVKEEDSSTVLERGQVLQSTQVVMNMVDLTMPGILTEDKKKKVLTAVDQGETLMKALQDAVPEDVREKLTTAVSGILHTQGSNLKLAGILDIGSIPSFSSGRKSQIQESENGISTKDGLHKDSYSSDQMHKTDNMGLGNASDDNQLQKENPATLEAEHDSTDRSVSFNEDDIPRDASDLGDNHDNAESSKVKPVRPERADWPEKEPADNPKMDEKSEVADMATNEEFNSQKIEEKSGDSLAEPRKISVNKAEEFQSSSGSPSETQQVENDDSDLQRRENKSLQPVLEQNKSNVTDSSSSTFSVSGALDALTGMDDSTQVAVNSVFGVLEEMITQLEESSDQENGETDKVGDGELDSLSSKHDQVHEKATEEQNVDVSNRQEKIIDAQSNGKDEFEAEKPAQVSVDSNQFSEGEGIPDNIDKQKIGKSQGQLVNRKLVDSSPDGLRRVNNIPLYIRANYGDYLHDAYFRSYLCSKYPTESLDKDATTALLLDYIPEEGQWKLLEQPGSSGDSAVLLTKKRHLINELLYSGEEKGTIEPSYTILDTQDLIQEHEMIDWMDKKAGIDDTRSTELMHFVRKIILDCLKVEVDRKRNLEDVEELESSLARDFDHVANAVCSVVDHEKEHISDLETRKYNIGQGSQKLGILQGEQIITAISSAVQETNYLRRVLPVGVIIGSCLAALRKSFDLATPQDNVEMDIDLSQAQKLGSVASGGFDEKDVIQSQKFAEINSSKLSATGIDESPIEKFDQDARSPLLCKEERNNDGKNGNNNKAMVGMVAVAALGTSALLVRQQKLDNGDSIGDEGAQRKELDKIDDASSGKDENNIVTSLAEKAMSVAGPVVPTKGDGGLDQERLVAMLTELGQRGGMLRLVSKIALLWGGLRGAMSLTDKLILFLRLAERPLFQRIVGFVAMVLVLWSPVVVPLFPTLVQSWMSHSSSGIADFACIFGLYIAVMILVMLWGKRIRGYEYPLKQYGLDLMSMQKVQAFLSSLVGGILLVLSIQYVNSLLGCVSFSWPPSLHSSSSDAMARLKSFGQILILVGRGAVTATSVALVEELLFRSWLTEEIAADLGYHLGIILSGLAFSLFQRSPWAIPGLWLLSLSLAGLRQIGEGSLSVPIGLRVGILVSSYTLQSGGFLIYNRNFPLWITGTHPFQPFGGIVGLTFSLVLAIMLYPREAVITYKTHTGVAT